MLIKSLPICLFIILILRATYTSADGKVNQYRGDHMHHCWHIKKQHVEKHLSTKTPYRAIVNLDDSPKIYEGCHATRIWGIIRHGTRNPSKKIIVEAERVLAGIKKRLLSNPNVTLCERHLKDLKHWKFGVSTKEEKFLVSEGEDELVELAERMQNRYPMLLPEYYDPSIYHFKYTATQRTLKSAESFASGLLGGRHQIHQIVYPEPLRKDPVLRVSLNIFL